MIVVSAWNNRCHSPTGSGHGRRITARVGRAHFSLDWKSVELELPTTDGLMEIALNVDKPSFWHPQCGELISKQIGQWLISQGFANWPEGFAPRFSLHSVAVGGFRVKLIVAAQQLTWPRE